jgi:hypothetical protein
MISVVYHCYLVGNWKEIVNEQLNRLKSSGLYDSADIIEVTVNLDKTDKSEFENVVSNYSKLNIEYFTDNAAEYPGIKKVRELALIHDTKIFYFHTKGVSNNYDNYNDKTISQEKIENIKLWRECLEYFLIDKWEESVELLESHDNVGVTCNGGWFWGNFWWSQSSHIKQTDEVGMWGRWDYEAWLNRSTPNSKNYEFHHFPYNPYVTKLDKELYSSKSKYIGDKIELIRAFYGTPPFQIDEGYSGMDINVGSDVTDVVKKLLEIEDNIQFNFNINNESMGGDSAHGLRKFLIVEFSPKSDLNKIYKMGLHEGQTLTFKF